MKQKQRVGRYSLAVVGEVDSKIHEVVFAPAGLVHDSLEHSLVNLVGDVPQHDLSCVS